MNNNNLVLKREIIAIKMLISYLIFNIISNFISPDGLPFYATLVVFCAISILLSFQIPKVFRGEQIVHIGLMLLLYSMHIPFTFQVILGIIGITLCIVGGRMRYIRLGRNFHQVYNWYL